MNASICRVAVSTSGKSARLRHLRLRMENHTSMKLSQEAWTGKKWKTKVRSGWASNQARTSAEWWELTGSRIRWMSWPAGVSWSSRPSSSQNSRERCWRRTRPHTWPSLTRKPASRSTVPWRTYSNSRRAGRPGAGGWSGTVGRRTPMPGLSSTQNRGPSVGGLSSRSMMATAFSTNWGSRSFIQVSKAVQAQLVALEDDADGALARRAQAQLGVCRHVLRQVRDGPMGRPGPRRVDLGRFLAGQHDQPGLDRRAVLARWTILGPIVQAGQPLLGEPAAPFPDGAHRQVEPARDVLVRLPVGGAQDDRGTVGGLLRPRPGQHAPFQLLAFGRLQHQRPATMLRLRQTSPSLPAPFTGAGTLRYPMLTLHAATSRMR